MHDLMGVVEVTDRRERSVPVCVIRGELDASNVDTVLERVVASVDRDAPGVVLDLAGLSFLDSAGVRILFDIARRLRAHRQELRLAAPRDGIVQRVLTLTALGDVVPVDASVDESVRALAART